MATDTQLTSFSDIRTYLHNMLRQVSSTATNTILDQMINTSLHDIHTNPGHNFPWAIRQGYLLTHAPYTTGTVSITAAARTTVTGSSTLWNTAVTGMGFNNARIGGKMTFAGSVEVHEVSAVGSDTAITILNRWTGDALTGETYVYYEDEYALATDFLRPYDMRNFSLDAHIPLIGHQDFRRLYPRNSLRGKPRVATLIQKSFSGDTTPRYRAVLHPAPDNEYSIPYNYITSYLAVTSAGAEQTQLVNDTDEPIIPLQFRHIIPLHAMVQWYLFRGDDSERAVLTKNEYNELLGRIANNTNMGSDRPGIRHGYAKYFGGRGLRRFDVNNRFDELRDRYSN